MGSKNTCRIMGTGEGDCAIEDLHSLLKSALDWDTLIEQSAVA